MRHYHILLPALFTLKPFVVAKCLQQITARIYVTFENVYVYSIITSSVGGIMVSIAAFQAVDPGSIPGHRSFLLLLEKIVGDDCT